MQRRSASAQSRSPLASRLGFPPGLGWGFVAVTIFMVGDGIELVWIANHFVTGLHYSVGAAGAIVTFYGVIVAIASFLSGALAGAIGSRRVMLFGLVSFIVFDALFIIIGLPSGNYPLLLLVYGLRGFGYPLFAYGFLTLAIQSAEPGKQAATSGWFWFVFSLGLSIFGSVLSSILLPTVGPTFTLWVGFVLAAVGGITGLILMRRRPGAPEPQRTTVRDALGRGLSIVWRVPKIGLGGLVKVINLTGSSALQVFLVTYLVHDVKMTESLAVLSFSLAGVFAIVGNLAWGFVGDKIGWRNTMLWFAAPLCAIAVLYLYYVPSWAGPNFFVLSCGMALLATGLSAFVPITPLMVAFAPEESGSALAIVNLGSGLAAFVGPGLVALLVGPLHYEGVIWLLAALYGVAFVILIFLRLPGNARTATTATAADAPAVPVVAEALPVTPEGHTR